MRCPRLCAVVGRRLAEPGPDPGALPGVPRLAGGGQPVGRLPLASKVCVSGVQGSGFVSGSGTRTRGPVLDPRVCDLRSSLSWGRVSGSVSLQVSVGIM